MTNRLLYCSCVGALALTLLRAAPAAAQPGGAPNVPSPIVNIIDPPEMMVIPKTLIYFAPDLQFDLLYTGGFYWTRKDDHWFRAKEYSGTWAAVDKKAVPSEIEQLQNDYRVAFGREPRIPHHQLKRHYELREQNRRGQERAEIKPAKAEVAKAEPPKAPPTKGPPPKSPAGHGKKGKTAPPKR